MVQVRATCPDHRLTGSDFLTVLEPLQLVISYRLLREGIPSSGLS